MAGWTCPKCHRSFKHANQSHSCKPAIPVEKHFEGRPPELKKAYDKLIKALHKRVPFTPTGVASAIHLVGESTFAGIRLTKSVMRVEFMLSRPLEHARVFKSEHFSATRHAHHVEVHGPGDVDEELLNWLVESAARA